MPFKYILAEPCRDLPPKARKRLRIFFQEFDFLTVAFDESLFFFRGGNDKFPEVFIRGMLQAFGFGKESCFQFLQSIFVFAFANKPGINRPLQVFAVQPIIQACFRIRKDRSFQKPENDGFECG